MKNYYKLGMGILMACVISACSKTDADFADASKNPANKIAVSATDTLQTTSIDSTASDSDTTDSKLTTESTNTSTQTKLGNTHTGFTGRHHYHHTKPTTPVTTKPTTPTTPVVTKPTTPVVTKPTTPVTTKPTTPTTPVVTKPTTPVVTKPTTPTTPVVTKPTTPVVTKPTTPVVTKPTTPVVTKPTTPVATKPTTPVNTPVATSGKYTITAPINLYNKSNVTISGDSIAGGGVACIQLTNCTNVHITHCKLGNSSSFGILIANCSNVLVDSCFINKVSTGILAINTTGSIRVQYNQILNTQGPFPQGGGIQFDNVNGGNNRINYNRIQNVAGQSNPEDKISIYKSNGTASDPIQIYGNWILGSGKSTTSCGITLGDQGGSYQVAKNNIIVNSGAGGAQIAGGTFISIINNEMYSAAFPWSHMGILCANYSGKPSNNLTISGNLVNWTSGNPNDQINGKTTRVMNLGSSIASAASTIIGASTNVENANINASILPASIINFK